MNWKTILIGYCAAKVCVKIGEVRGYCKGFDSGVFKGAEKVFTEMAPHCDDDTPTLTITRKIGRKVKQVVFVTTK